LPKLLGIENDAYEVYLDVLQSDSNVSWSKVYSDCTNIDKDFRRIGPL